MSNLQKINQIIKSGEWIKYAGKCEHSPNQSTPCKKTCLKIANGKKIIINCAVCKIDYMHCDIAAKIDEDDTITIKGVEYSGSVCKHCFSSLIVC